MCACVRAPLLLIIQIVWIELCNLLCLQVPIYVNKQIILTDAIRIVYGMGRARDTKSVYDVVLDRYYCACSRGLVFMS